MSWGISYLGSKSKIVKHILPHLPAADNFVDLFAGGGAVTHYAMTTGKYKHFIYNDLNPLAVKGFKMALNGDFEKDKRWISHEDFFRLRDTDPYVAICFSFSNDTHSYIYGRAIEPVKEAYHYAIFFDDYSLAKERIGVDLSPLAECSSIESKYAMLKQIIKNTTPSTIETRLQSMERRQTTTAITPPGTQASGGRESGKTPKKPWYFQSLEARQRCIITPQQGRVGCENAERRNRCCNVGTQCNVEPETSPV